MAICTRIIFGTDCHQASRVFAVTYPVCTSDLKCSVWEN